MKPKLSSLLVFVMGAAASAWIGLWALDTPGFISQKYDEFRDVRSRRAALALVDEHYEQGRELRDELRLFDEIVGDAWRYLPNALNDRYNAADELQRIEMGRRYSNLADRINSEFGDLRSACSSYTPELREDLRESVSRWGALRMANLREEIPQLMSIWVYVENCSVLGQWNWTTGHHHQMNCAFPEISPHSICYSTAVACDEGNCDEESPW